MKIVKPVKVPVLTRTLESGPQCVAHVAAMLGFRLTSPRDLLDELAFWRGVLSALGERGIIDEGISKPHGEFLVAGSFHAPGGVSLGASYVRVQIAGRDKRLAVIGDRHWKDGVPTTPTPMTTMPIDWAHALGGPQAGSNPHGIGIDAIERDGRLVQPLPNVELYGKLIRSPTERPDPGCFAPRDVTFSARKARAGTYDKAWLEQRFPGLAADAAPEFHNVAIEDQWISGFFRGDEPLLIENMCPEQPLLEGHLPGLTCRSFATIQRPEGEAFVELGMRCDTVWLFPTAGFGVVIFHGALPVRADDAADVVHLVVGCEESGKPRALEHYRDVLARRLDKDEGALAGLSDRDLMPAVDSGVVPDIQDLDIGRWVKGEGLAQTRQRKGAERARLEARARVLADGGDPDECGLAEPIAMPAPPEVGLDGMAALVRATTASARDERAQVEEEAARDRERARQQFVELGLDYDQELEKQERGNAGPPKFSAAAFLDQMVLEVRGAREEGVPLDALEQQLLDPEFRAQLVTQEQALLGEYRTGAHLQAAPYPMSAELSRQARVVAQAAINSGESLAERDFTGVDWSGMKLAGLDLRGVLLEASNLEGCDLSGARLDRAVLAKARLKGATLAGASLRGANLGASNLHGAVLDGADLREAILSRAELDGASFRDARLAGVDFVMTKFGNVDLSGAKLPGANVLNAELQGVSFVGADLTDATLVECQLDGADFSHALMVKTTFVSCKGEGVCFREATFQEAIVVHGSALPKADFRDAKMAKANLRGTVLTAALLDRADLTGADLSDCDATGASLERAVLVGGVAIRTQLRNASLRGANLMDVLLSKSQLQGANLSGANLARADLSRALADEHTKLEGIESAQARFLPKATPPAGGTS